MTTTPLVPDIPICVALDLPDSERVLSLATATRDSVGVFKVGLTAIYGAGTDVVPALSEQRPVFLDAKLHDIPKQVSGAVEAIASLGIRYVTVHAAGGEEMVAAAVKAAGDSTAVLAVTILTSLDEHDLTRIGIAGGAESAVLRLAEIALDAGAPGLVCSPLEVEPVRSRFGTLAEGGPLLVVPGIRPAGSARDDQARVLGPREALELGADVLVVGRPITAADDPGAAAASILSEVGS